MLYSRVLSLAFCITLLTQLGSCTPSDGPQTGSQTNWMRVCKTAADCGSLDCVCGACTETCTSARSCSNLEGALCLDSTDARTLALCDAVSDSPSRICVPGCTSTTCPSGTQCDGGVCIPKSLKIADVEVDLTSRYQKLVGFGASLAYGEDAIVAHPKKAALLDSMFADLGLNVLRFRDRYRSGASGTLDATAEIIAEAKKRMDSPPTLILTSGSPPPELKENGTTDCPGDPAGCTLRRTDNGDFDYTAFADNWRASLEAFAAQGIEPDFLSIQNNPDWLPEADDTNEACRLLPEEGTTMVTRDGVTQSVTYAGYREAMDAVMSALMSLPMRPELLGPETSSLTGTLDYAALVQTAPFAALAFHLYESDPAAPDLDGFAELASLAQDADLPLYQTETNADGLSTAMLIHQATTLANAEMYLQNDFVTGPGAPSANPSALLALSSDDFEHQGPYFALQHFAHRTGRGWIRVEATSSDDGLLASAWLSPDEKALTLIVVNSSDQAATLALNLDGMESDFSNQEVTQTDFSGEAPVASTTELPSNLRMSLSARTVMTVALWQ